MAAKEGSSRHEGLLRAGSWQAQGEAVLLKTASDIMLQMAMSGGLKQHHLAAEDGGEGGKTNSVDSSSTAAGQRPHALLLDSATAGMLPPLRQISLDVIAASELNRAKGGVSGSGERQSIFQDVFEQLAGKDDLPPLQGGQLYTLPSMQFLENMLNDFDRTGTSSAAPMTNLHGPLDLPGDAFDLPEFSSRGGSSARQREAFAALRPTPFDQQQAAAAQQQAYYLQPDCTTAAGYASFVPIGSAPASLQAQMGHSMHNSSGSLTLQASMRAQSAYESRGGQAGMLAAPGHPHHMLIMQQQHYHQQAAAAAAAASAAATATSRLPPGAASPGVRQPAVPQPAQPRATPRRASQAYADFDYEEAEVSLQTSKSGRVRKVASFTGVKRRLDVANGGNAASESRDSRGSVGGGEASSGEVGSRGSKGARKTVSAAAKNRKGRRTVCLNCGCHQTPQWRCGPLGPRTLCNACGVRYKKDLPLNCWPIRDGMTLPPGALLPPGFVVPPGITIHTQPAEQE